LPPSRAERLEPDAPLPRLRPWYRPAVKRTALPLYLLALGLVCCAGGATDGYGWYVDGTRVPDEDWRAHDGPFLAQLVLTADARALQAAWTDDPAGAPVHHLDRAAPGSRVETAIFFSRCEPDGAGVCSVWGTATVEASDGRVLANRVEVPLWVDQPPPAGLGVSEHGLGMVVEDFAGSYTFRFVVTDRVARREVSLMRELAVARAE